MDTIRVTHTIDPKLNFDCNKIHIADYIMEEVMLPPNKKQEARKAISIIVRGRNLRAVAQPLIVFVGDTMVSYLRIAPDERSVQGILLNEPKEGAHVDVLLGDQDHARHPVAVRKEMIKRIG